jgi:hypothetical protein
VLVWCQSLVEDDWACLQFTPVGVLLAYVRPSDHVLACQAPLSLTVRRHRTRRLQLLIHLRALVEAHHTLVGLFLPTSLDVGVVLLRSLKFGW